MNKSLEALEEIIDDFVIVQDALDVIDKTSQRDKDYFKQWLNERKNIIETALKNYQELLKKPCVLMGRTNGHTKALIDTICKNYKEVKITNLEDEKKLKTLEIIKEKMINVCAFISWNNIVNFTYEKYQELQLTYLISAKRLTKEEFDLLKEYYCK